MKGFVFLGNIPQIEGDDIIEMDSGVKRYDIVSCERVGPRNILICVVKPEDYADFSEIMYQVDQGEQEGTFQLRQVQMRFWPW